jgi:hypothetical protein
VPAHALVLEANVEHSDRLAPVNEALAPGQPFDRDNLPSFANNTPSNRWYHVPGWLVGKWHKDTQTDYYQYDYRSGATDVNTKILEAKADATWGTQADPRGQIWQFDPAPYVTTVDAGDQLVVQIVRLSEPVDEAATHFVRRSVDVQIRVDKATNIIKSVQAAEEITVYLPEGNGLVKRECSAKVSDRFGQPVLLAKSFSYERQVAGFVPEAVYKDRELRPLFEQFLQDLSQKGAQ